MTSLYDLTSDWLSVAEMAGDPDVDPDVIAGTLESIEGDIEDKADGYAKVIKTLEAEQTAIKAEIDRLKKNFDTRAKNVERMKKSLQYAMILTGKPKFKTALFGFAIQKNPASVTIDPGVRVPEEYLIPQEPKVDKTALKNALKDGMTFDGIYLTQSESLRIR